MRTSTSFLVAAAILATSWMAALGSTTISITGQESYSSSSHAWDVGTLSIQTGGVTETIAYGRYSTPASVAAGLAAIISQDCNNPLIAYADNQGNITLNYRTGSGIPTVNGSESSNYGLTSFSFSTPQSGGGTGGGGAPPTGGGGTGGGGNGGNPPIVGGPGAPTESTGTVLYSYRLEQFDSTTSGYDPKGNITAYTDSVDGQWTAGYDNIDRITSAAQIPTTSSAANVKALQYLCWVYDSFGNRTLQARSGSSFNGTCSTTAVASENYVSSTYSDPVNLNRVTSVSGEAVNPNGTGSWTVSADLAGNTTQDAVNQYVYDGEGRLCATVNTVYSTWTGYLYDAEGNRVAKGTLSPQAGTDPCDSTTNGFKETNEYIIGPTGEQLTELNGAGKWLHTNAFANGQLVGTYGDLTGSSNAIHFQLSDWLGTRRVQTDDQATVEETCSSGTFGDALDCAAPNGTVNDATELHFTGKERDTESGLDYFGARYYASNMGRWTSPDWADKPEAVPYSTLDNPQSLNLYEYVGNNPLSRADADGHCDPNGGNCSVWDHVAGAVGGVLNIVPGTLNLGVQAFNAVSGSVGGPQLDALPMIQPDAHASGGGVTTGGAAQILLPIGDLSEGAQLLKGATSGVEVESVATSASKLAGETGKTSAEFTTESSVGRIDLTGKAHFDKPTGTSIETPHVHEQQIHTSPSGQTNLGSKTTRPATGADVQRARDILTKDKP